VWDVVVIGAGAAGLLAAARAAERGRRVLLLEKNRKPGVKILMSGGTRCNLTHATDKHGIIAAFGPQGRFLHSALAALGPSDLVDLFHAEGVPTKVEPTGKIFPVSDKAIDVLEALKRRLARSGAQLALEEPVLDVAREDDGFLIRTSIRTLHAAKVIVTVGGQSYPGAGTTGDGYAWAANLDHTIVPPRPALAPLTSGAPWVKSLRGVTIPDVRVKLQERATSKTIAERRGSFLFTHFGLSGPAPMDVSREAAHFRPGQMQLVCDFLPEAGAEQLSSRLQAEAAASGKKQIVAIVTQWLPRRLAESLLEQARLPADRRGAEFSKAERSALVQAIKAIAIPIEGTLGFKKAEVTAGGVSLAEVDSRTMQSKLVPNLFFAGEVLDVDGPIGGYNFQAAFSTGWLAGESV
jgi:predicted Rossmann fold flavoprotein